MKESIVASANLTQGGIEGNIKVGIGPISCFVDGRCCNFVDTLYLKEKV
jgi:hypothetical protein